MVSKKYVEVPPERLRPNPVNVRIHTKKQIESLGKIIDAVTFTAPIIVDENYIIQAGHARWEAAKQRGLRKVPVVVITGLTEAQKRLLILADNKLAEKGNWDAPALANELSILTPLLTEEGLDISLSGFEIPEIDSLMANYVDSESDPADDCPQLQRLSVSRLGDLFDLAGSRLLCGDARKETDVRKLMQGHQARMGFVDPPYNVRVSSIQGRGKRRHREFLMASGELSIAEYTSFLSRSLSLAAQFSLPGSLHYVCMDWRHLRELQTAADQAYSELVNLCVWVKTNGGQGSFYRSRHELIFVYRHRDSPHLNNIELGRHGRNRSNVWEYAGVNTFRAGRLDDLSTHPTVKPVALVADAIRDCTARGDIVLDPFMGSGTTIMAAERVGRRAYGLEIDPLYVDAIIRRWQAFTGRDATLKKTGQTFDELAAARAKTEAGRD
jgi:DNA modification methylase